MSDSSPQDPRFIATPYDFGAALEISERLDLRLPIATALVRRGVTTPEEVSSLITGEPENDPYLLEDMDEAVELILEVARSKERITVHGDYDADGVCATSIMVECLRGVGAEVDWFLPDRTGGGYGVSQTSIDEMLQRGTSLMITVDCGISSRDEVATLQEAGVRCVVSDHHEQPDELPACPVIHPARGGYPFSGLCGAGVAYKLASALRSEAGVETDSGVDLVALATVADLVPLTGENRTLVRRGLNKMRTSPRTGIQALMEAARVSPDEVDAGALGFRLAPRINAAGRLYRADAGVELMLSEDPARAKQIGEELNRANSERRSVEREVMNGAESARRGLSSEQLEAPALVLAGEGWHPGVVGIVASRLAEKYWRPVVLIALEKGIGRGSGRSIKGYDLLAGITAGGEFLNRFGGHKMAAGLEIEESQIDAFRKAFTADAAEHLGPTELKRVTEVDAVIGAGRHGVDMELAEQLETLEPFGMGNPRPTFLVPSAKFNGVRGMGKDGKHVSFDLDSGSGRVKGVGFGLAGELEGIADTAADVEVQVEMNRWNDSVEARVVVREVAPLEAGADGVELEGVGLASTVWWERLDRELELSGKEMDSDHADGVGEAGDAQRRELDRRDAPVIPAVLDLASTGDSLLVVSCDAIVRRGLVSAADSARVGAASPLIAPGAASSEALGFATEPGSVVFADWDAISTYPQSPAGFEQIAVVDPPWSRREMDLLRSAQKGRGDAGYLHLLWHTADLAAAQAALHLRWDVRAAAVDIWRALDGAGGSLAGEDLESKLRASEPAVTRPPESTARALRALAEAGQVELDRAAEQPSVSLLEGGGRLEDSATFIECQRRFELSLDVLTGVAASASGAQAQAA